MKPIILFASVVYALSSFAQLKNIGPIISYTKETNGISGKTGTAFFRIDVYDENTIRVWVSQKNKKERFSYALVSNEIPAFNKFSLSEKTNEIILSTASLNLHIEKYPAFRTILKTNTGILINEDMPGEGFGTTFFGEKPTVYKRLMNEERFVGLGEVLGNLDKRGQSFSLNNTDTYKYGDSRLSMYASIPFYIGLHPKGFYGIYFNNSYKSFFNFGSSTPGFSSFSAEGGDADYFLFYDTSIAKIIEHFTAISGRMSLPPQWALGYHQSRCSYYPQENVSLLAETFRRKKIPVDCIVLDADYLHEYEPFRTNTNRFPNLPALAKELKSKGIELTASINPGIKIDSSYAQYKDALAKNVLLRYANGSLFTSDIAPNTNHFIDFTNPKGRAWWATQIKYMVDNGIHGIWNDMNEPAVAGSYLPDNLVFDFDGHKSSAAEGKNLYGMLMARSSYEGYLQHTKNMRPFVLSRSGFAGIQRYAAMWTGDNTAQDEYLLSGSLLNNQMGLSGVPFVGPDIGGYIGSAPKALFMRWMQVGMFSPFVRNHREFYSTAGEPWAYGEDAEAISRNYINLRYRLMPYVYSIFKEASVNGMPIARSLCMNYPLDDKIYTSPYQYQFLFGPSMMVIPVTPSEQNKKIYLPAGDWYNLYSDKKITGPAEWTEEFPLHQLPIFIKESAIIPQQSLSQSAAEKPGDTLFVHVYNGKTDNRFVWYEDDGRSLTYQQGNFYQREIAWQPTNSILKISAASGAYASTFKKICFVFHAMDLSGNKVFLNGQKITLSTTSTALFDCLESLEDVYYPDTFNGFRKQMNRLQLPVITTDNISGELKIVFK